MSSLAAARADNFYYPKDWRPEHGSLNAFHGSHALGKRAKDLAADGVLVVRFEMPFNVWCLHCETHIGRGVRFNARKKKVGMYFSTPLYEFRLKCATCAGDMVVETDPQQRDYKLVSGVQRQRTAADEAEAELEDTGVERLDDPRVGLQASQDPFFRLENERSDLVRAKQRARGLEAVVEIQEKQFKDDYRSNAALRARFRERKHHLQSNARRADALGLGITLVDAEDEDVAHAKGIVYEGRHGKRQRGGDTKRRRGTKETEEDEDSFQFFGDATASKLHQLKKKKKKKEQSQPARYSSVSARAATASRSLVAKPPRGRTAEDRVAARARKLLERR